MVPMFEPTLTARIGIEVLMTAEHLWKVTMAAGFLKLTGPGCYAVDNVCRSASCVEHRGVRKAAGWCWPIMDTSYFESFGVILEKDGHKQKTTDDTP